MRARYSSRNLVPMTTTATHYSAEQAAPAALVRIVRGEGPCADCGKECTARQFEVQDKATGATRHLGRRCAARATGYPTNAVEREARQAERLAVIYAREAVIVEAFPIFVGIDERHAAMMNREVPWSTLIDDHYSIRCNARNSDHLWRDGDGWREYVEACLPNAGPR